MTARFFAAGIAAAALTLVSACGDDVVPGTPTADSTSTTLTSVSATPTTTSPKAAAASTTVPPAAWIPSAKLPLADSENWPELSTVAEPLGTNSFQVTELCSGTPFAVGDADNARAVVDNGADNWSAEQVIVHYPGDPWTMGQTAHAVFTTLQSTLTGCKSASAQVSVTTAPNTHCPSVQRGPCNQVAAEIDLPDKHAHVYLAAVGSAITELTVWSTGSPATPWTATDDEGVFAAMNPQLCTVWEC